MSMDADADKTPPRWSIVRLIWFRELRDQLRDRRTLFMIAVLPLVLYPALGFAVLQFAAGFGESAGTIGIVRGPRGSSDLPESDLANGSTPAYPPLVKDGRFLAPDRSSGPAVASEGGGRHFKLVFLPDDSLKPLEEKQVDLILKASPEFFATLEGGAGEFGRQPRLIVHSRPDDDRSRIAAARLGPILQDWEHTLHATRLQRLGLGDLSRPSFEVEEPELTTSPPTSMLHWLVRIFPFMLVMWSLAGALYPAVDLCAGEKERGTMETLLVSPAGRQEIVFGKFLTIWVFSAGTALLNLV